MTYNFLLESPCESLFKAFLHVDLENVDLIIENFMSDRQCSENCKVMTFQLMCNNIALKPIKAAEIVSTDLTLYLRKLFGNDIGYSVKKILVMLLESKFQTKMLA